MDENKISMTADELAKLVDSRIAEHDREVERAKQLAAEPPKTDPDVYITPPRNPAFEAVLLKALDEQGGDVRKAAWSLYARIQPDTRGVPADKSLAALFDQWRRNPKTGLYWGFQPYEPGLIETYMGNLKLKRERERAKVAS